MHRIEPCAPYLPRRASDTNKYDYGRVLIVGGCVGYTGAPTLCAHAALRCGAGLVSVGVPEAIYAITAVKNDAAMPFPLPSADGKLTADALPELLERLRRSDVCVLGPGLGRNAALTALVQAVVLRSETPLVLDADALNLLATDPELFVLVCQRKDPAILTPHLVEMARLTGKSVRTISEDLIDSCRSFASQHHLICVQKDARTVVSDGSHVFLNTTGNSGMATGGSGDVLTGILLGLLAQRPTPFESAVAAVTLHGLAGDAAASSRSSYSMIAGDIAEQVGTVLLDAENQTNLFQLS